MTKLVWRGLVLHHAYTYYKFTSWWSARPTRRCPMPVPRAVKASAQTGASAPPVEEPVESPATPAPEGTTGQGGDGDSESGSPAASSAAKAPEVHHGSATQPGADAAADLAAAPTQTMEAAGISGTVEEVVKTPSDMSGGEDDEEIVDREPVGKAKATGNGKGTAEVVRRCSRRGQGMAPESDGPPDVPDGGESAASGQARAKRADELEEVEEESEQDSEEEDEDYDTDEEEDEEVEAAMFTRYQGNDEKFTMMNHCYDTWDEWIPSTPLESACQRAVENGNQKNITYE